MYSTCKPSQGKRFVQNHICYVCFNNGKRGELKMNESEPKELGFGSAFM
jgi:hypothetical protein